MRRRAHLPTSQSSLCFRIRAVGPEQDQHTGAYAPDLFAFDLYRCLPYPLNQCNHARNTLIRAC